MKKVLVIVDIQQNYNQNFSQSYLNKIKNYLEKNSDSFSEIYVMIDILNHNKDGDYIPKFLSEYKNVKYIFKCYNKKYTIDKLKESNSLKIKELDDGFLSIEPKMFGSKYIKKLEKGYLLSGVESDGRFIEYVDEDFSKIILNWKKNNCQILLIGGGLEHCVQKTSTILDVFDISNKILKTYCFQIKDGKTYRKEFEDEWVFIKNKNMDLKNYLKRT